MRCPSVPVTGWIAASVLLLASGAVPSFAAAPSKAARPPAPATRPADSPAPAFRAGRDDRERDAERSNDAKPARDPAAEASREAARPGRELADAWPSASPAGPDLQLSKDGAKKAEALGQFAAGLLLEDAAENDDALVKFRRAFDLDPSNADLAVKLAYMLAQRNDPTAGIEVLKDAIKASPRETLPLIYLSQLYAKYLKKPDAGLRYAESALALDPTGYAGYLAMFELLAATNQPAKIEQLFQRALKSGSTNAQFWLQIGGLFQQAHLKDDGTAVSPEALQEMNGVFKKAAALAPEDALVLARVGNYFVDSKQVNDAIPFYFKALTLKQTSDDPVLANAGDKLARALNEAGMRDKAIEVLEKITHENPTRFETFELLGELYETSGEIDKALGAFKHSILLDASEPRNHIRVAYMQMQKKRYDEAVETALAARARFPDNPEALYLLAIALSQAKKHTESLTAFAEALAEFQNGHDDLLNSQFYFSYGAAAEQAGLLEKAAEMLKKSISLDPNSVNAAQSYNYLGYMWVDRGENLDEGGDMIKKALEMEPENGAYLDSLGWFYFKKGDYEKAAQQLLKASELIKPEDPVVLEHLGDVYQQMGKSPLALQYFQKALTLDADNKKVAEKVEAMKQKVSSNKATRPEAAPVPAQ